jgi:hypothetical protein
MPSGFDKYSLRPCNSCHAYSFRSDGSLAIDEIVDLYPRVPVETKVIVQQ